MAQVESSLGIANNTSGVNVAVNRCNTNDPLSGEARYSECITINENSMYSPAYLQDGYLSRGVTALVSIADGVDLTDTSGFGDSIAPTENYRNLHVAVEHSASDGTCVITPVIYDCGDLWASGGVYAEGAVVRPSAYGEGANIPYLYKCTTGGTSGTTEPVWGDATESDGTVTWTRQAFGSLVGTLASKTFTASTLRRGATGNFISPAQSWEILGAWYVGLHITAIGGTSNDVLAMGWLN